jgi:hypothetical protein
MVELGRNRENRVSDRAGFETIPLPGANTPRSAHLRPGWTP